MTPRPIRIVIADDHPIFRRGLRQIIETDSDLEVIAEVGDGEAALDRIRRLRPDVCVADVEMPKKDGFELARIVQAENISVGLIFLTMYKEERFFNAALDLNVRGYVLKDGAVTEINDCIRAVADGTTYISPTVSAFLVNRTRKPTADTPNTLESLTAAERRVLKLIAEYKTSRQIADLLCVSVRTVEHHRANLASKLDLKGNHAVLQFALGHRDQL